MRYYDYIPPTRARRQNGGKRLMGVAATVGAVTLLGSLWLLRPADAAQGMEDIVLSPQAPGPGSASLQPVTNYRPAPGQGQQDLPLPAGRYGRALAASQALTAFDPSAPRAARPAAALPSIPVPLPATEVEVPEASEWVTVKLHRGWTLDDALRAAGVTDTKATALYRLSPDTPRLKHLAAGDELRIRRDGDELDELHFALDPTHTLEIDRDDDDRFEASVVTAELERRLIEVSGTIRHSINRDARKAGMPARVLREYMKLFDYDVDFGQDVHIGDRFAVVYETLWTKEGRKIQEGGIVAADFLSADERVTRVRWQNPDGTYSYFTPDGLSNRTAFIRNPLDVVRITSNFDLARFHPILHTIRAHKGVDYGASAGTPIKTTGDGVVIFQGVKGGYGNVTVVRHNSVYETLYGHMSRFALGVHTGTPVRLGQVIGYVGASGLATAPHLHYEFHVNGQYVNPMTVKLPRANPMSRRQLASFQEEALPLLARLDRAQGTLDLVAQATRAVASDASPTAGTGAAAAVASRRAVVAASPATPGEATATATAGGRDTGQASRQARSRGASATRGGHRSGASSSSGSRRGGRSRHR